MMEKLNLNDLNSVAGGAGVNRRGPKFEEGDPVMVIWTRDIGCVDRVIDAGTHYSYELNNNLGTYNENELKRADF